MALGAATDASVEADTYKAEAMAATAELTATKAILVRTMEAQREAQLDASRRVDAAAAEVERMRLSAAEAQGNWEVERQVLLDEIHMARMRAAKVERRVVAVQREALSTSHQHQAMLGDVAIATRRIEQQQTELDRSRERLEKERREMEAEREAALKRMEEVRAFAPIPRRGRMWRAELLPSAPSEWATRRGGECRRSRTSLLKTGYEQLLSLSRHCGHGPKRRRVP